MAMAPADGQIHALFERQAKLTPETPAIYTGGRHVTYRELDRLANGIAHQLVQDGSGSATGEPLDRGSGSLVGVLLDRDEWLPAAILGVLKAGAAYVPLDPGYPAERIRFIGADTGMRQVLTSPARAAHAKTTGARPILVGAAPADTPPPGRGDPHDPAYVIYTSGSTGQPKGVVVEHHSVVNLLRWSVGAFSEAELAGVLAATSVCFDVSVAELFTPLVSGGALVMADDLLALPDLPDRDRVRTVFGVPSALAALLRFPLPPGIATVVPAGEALPRALVDKLYAQPGVRRVLNCFGPTECTVYCAAFEVPREATAAPAIGSAVAGAELSVRDPQTGAERAGDEAGELWVAGPGLARGYLDRPDLTARRFVSDAGTRWYRTGDLVRPGRGGLHYLGRLDDQVKIRGHRVELGELQAALAAHPAVAQAVVLAPADAHGTRTLVGYVVPAPAGPAGGQPVSLDEAGLRAWLTERLPGYVLPTHLVTLDRLPLGPTGKVDRSALPAPAPARSRSTAPEAPRSPLEEQVAEVVAEVLGLPEVGVTDRFGDLGGHSLAAATVVARLAARLGAPVPVRWFLAEPTVAALAQRIAGAGPARGPDTAPASGPVRHPGQQVFPLTDLQQELWLARRVHPDASTTIAFRLQLTGTFEAAAVRDGLTDLVRRHEVLRTSFEEWEDGPVAVVRPPVPVPVAEWDATGDRMSPADRAAVEAEAVQHVFDLTGEVPLIRGTLVHTGPGTAELIVAVDHIAFDGWSMGILMRELVAALAGRPVPEPALQVGDLARFELTHAEDQTRLAELRRFWRESLAGLELPPELTGGGSGHRTARGARIIRPLPPDLVRAVDSTTRSLRVSRFAGYASALAVVLHRLTGQPVPVIGTGAAVRDLPGLEPMIGPLVRVLPTPLDTTGDPTFAELAARAASAATQAVSHQDITAADLDRCAGLDRPPGASRCPVVLTMQPEGMPVVAEAGEVRVALAGEVPTGMATADLVFFVNQTAAGTEVHIEYDVGLYHESDVVTILDLWLRVLHTAATDPSTRRSTFDLLTTGQRDRVRQWGRGAPLPAERPATVVDAILAQVRDRPASVAVVGPDGELSYAELGDLSSQIAAALAAAGAGAGDRVGVCVPRDRRLPAALVGVMRAGAAYVPMDAEYPAERLAWLAADCAVQVVVCAGATSAAAGQVPGVTLVDLDRLPPAEAAAPPPPGPDDVAYVLYTSGSTGRPKGVEVTHANLAAHTTAIQRCPGMSDEDAVLAVAPLSFDAAGVEIWSPLATGARCVVVERDRVLDGSALAKRVAEVKATVALLPPTLLRILLAGGWTGDAGLRVWCGGETLDPELVREVAPRVAEVWNVYAPTETTTLSTVHRVVGTPGQLVPIGSPLPGEWVYVVDQQGALVPPGVVGELWIGGAGVARGYLGRPDLTEARFVPDPYQPGGRCYRTGDRARWNADGLLEFLGRGDHQVKLRGQRVELGEIEAVIRKHPHVAQAVVTVRGTGPDTALVGYLVPEPVDPALVVRFLRHHLPEYLVPGQWVTLPALPTTSSGKVDRRRLPEPAPAAAIGGRPASELEQLIAEVWQEVLGAATGDIGRGNSFFAWGGNSFAATRVVARLRAVLACDVPVKLLLERPRLADFAAAVESLAVEQLAVEQLAAEQLAVEQLTTGQLAAEQPTAGQLPVHPVAGTDTDRENR